MTPTSSEVREIIRQCGQICIAPRHCETMTKVQIALSQFAELLERERWIPVTEALPEERRHVLTWDEADECKNVHICYRNDALFFVAFMHERELRTVTHWRPLPLPPEGE